MIYLAGAAGIALGVYTIKGSIKGLKKVKDLENKLK